MINLQMGEQMSSSPPPGHRRGRLAAILAFALLVSACGTRLSMKTIAADAGGSRSATGGNQVAGSDAGDNAAALSGAEAGSGGTSGSTGGQSGSLSAGAAAATGTSGGQSGSGGLVGSSGPLGQAASGSEVVIGNIGTYSGVIGGVLAGGNTMARVWARSVNGRGGLSGHPVRVVQGDDGGDPARALQLAKDMVENQHAIAFFGNLTPLSTSGYTAYLQQKGVPVVGGDLVTPAWHQTPILFPQGTFVNNIAAAAVKLGVANGHRNLAMLFCGEASACTNARDVVVSQASSLGANLVYSAQISLGQPDFTAECLQAKNHGADALFIAADGPTAGRALNSCVQQGYHPLPLTASLAVITSLTQNPNLDGLWAPEATFPWFLNSTPAIQEYRHAVLQYAPDLQLASATSAVWTAGKLLERAGSHLGSHPTSQDILLGLWSLRNETLGGLAPPLTFHEGQPPDKSPCYFVVQIKGGQWTAPNGINLSC